MKYSMLGLSRPSTFGGGGSNALRCLEACLSSVVGHCAARACAVRQRTAQRAVHTAQPYQCWIAHTQTVESKGKRTRSSPAHADSSGDEPHAASSPQISYRMWCRMDLMPNVVPNGSHVERGAEWVSCRTWCRMDLMPNVVPNGSHAERGAEWVSCQTWYRMGFASPTV
eukprot:366436-Chlamydomonas_euryale.AAC.4